MSESDPSNAEQPQVLNYRAAPLPFLGDIKPFRAYFLWSWTGALLGFGFGMAAEKVINRICPLPAQLEGPLFSGPLGDCVGFIAWMIIAAMSAAPAAYFFSSVSGRESRLPRSAIGKMAFAHGMIGTIAVFTLGAIDDYHLPWNPDHSISFLALCGLCIYPLLPGLMARYS
jgi:hypothetical protein